MCLHNANAQMSAGVNVGMLKSFEDDSDAMLGFSVSGKYAISEKIRIGANLGYYSKSYEFFGVKLKAFTMPITGLFEYSLSDNSFSPYVGADAGIYSLGVSGGSTSSSEAYLGFAPVVGLNYKISDQLHVNANAKYHVVMSDGESSTFFGINAGVCYVF